MKSVEGKTLCSLTPIASPNSTLPSLYQMELNQTTLGLCLSNSQAGQTPKPSYATDLIQSMGAGTQPMTVDSGMPARDANEQTMGRKLAIIKRDLALELQPKYLWHNVWDGNDYFSRLSTDWSETVKPLPNIPKSELLNLAVMKTIKDNPSLFDIIMPINVDCFELLLESHLNQPFVRSVCHGLHEGFWPWANTHSKEYPDILDLSSPQTDNPKEAQFLCDQCDHEIFKGHFSEAICEKLLSGMYCVPVFAIPKPHSTDLWMVTHQSTGNHSLNSMIPQDNIVGYPLDNLCHLGEFLLSMHCQNPNSPCVLFKSDVAEAYWLLPVHPYWQIKQVNHIDGSLHVNRNCMFSGHASGCNWISFMSLVSWIAKKKCNIELLGMYSDDSFGPEHEHNVTWYTPYWKFMPTNQARILQLWDKINLPHKEKKQVYRSVLTIIGIEVYANTLTMLMPPDSSWDLIAVINDFINSHWKFSLKEWQRLAGWINWSFNIFPLLRPALNNFYAKISGKSAPNRYVRINNAICMDLAWAVSHLEHDTGIQLIEQLHWEASSTNFTLYCDACLEGMGF